MMHADTNGVINLARTGEPVADLVALIIPHGDRDKARKVFKESGVVSKTILHAFGTAHSGLAKFLGLDEQRKMMVMTVTPPGAGSLLLQRLATQLNIMNPGRGIGMRIELKGVHGLHREQVEDIAMTQIHENDSHETHAHYEAIFTIVERGHSDEVLDAARSAGARGGTVINGRGSGVHETQKVFGMEIEPEKEIILILATTEATQPIVDAIRRDCRIDEPGGGIIFVSDVAEAVGLR